MHKTIKTTHQNSTTWNLQVFLYKKNLIFTNLHNLRNTMNKVDSQDQSLTELSMKLDSLALSIKKQTSKIRLNIAKGDFFYSQHNNNIRIH